MQVLFRVASLRVKSTAGEVPVVWVLFRRSLPKRGVQAFPAPRFLVVTVG